MHSSLFRNLELLGGILLLHSVGAGCGALLVELGTHGAMELLLKDRLGLNGLELGFEVPDRMRARVAAATGIGYVVAHILDLSTGCAPVDCQKTVMDECRRDLG